MDEGKKSVILYTEWAQPLKTLSLEDKGRIFDAILSYSETGETPHFDSAAAEMAFSFIRLRLDENARKWTDVRQKRQEAGKRGALIANSKKQQSSANPANADFAETNPANVGKSRQSPANPAVNVNVNANVNDSVAAKAAIAQTSPDTPPEQPAAPPQQPPSLDGLETSWRELGLGRRMGPVVQQALRAYLAAGLEEGLIVQAMREAAEHDVKATLPYIRSILDRCQAQGIHTLDAWQAAHRGGGGKRVDRAQPSGNDFLADALNRPRRHKRQD